MTTFLLIVCVGLLVSYWRLSVGVARDLARSAETLAEAKRINEETRAILDHAGIDPPEGMK
jgi:hypothetical protein